MAHKGTGFFDRKGKFYKTAREATESDLSAIIGQVGDGESLAPGIAHLMLDRRAEIERLFAEHDEMVEGSAIDQVAMTDDKKVAKLPTREAG